MSTENNDKLEASLHRVLRSVGDRQVPNGFERRVLNEIARRAALPWWQRSFAYWPFAVRALFFVASAAVAGALVYAVVYALHSPSATSLADDVSRRFGWLALVRKIASATQVGLGQRLASASAIWIYAALGLFAGAYAFLGAAGAAAYRAFQGSDLQS